MTRDEQKKRAAEAALEFVEDGMVVGVGTGSTTNHFIDGLARLKGRIDGAVSSSEASTRRLQAHSIAVLDLNEKRGHCHSTWTARTNPTPGYNS